MDKAKYYQNNINLDNKKKTLFNFASFLKP